MENLTELSLLVRLLPGILCGVILGWNAGRLPWPRGIRRFAAHVAHRAGKIRLPQKRRPTQKEMSKTRR